MTNLQPGQTLGPYRITAQVGEGGMATVYKAYQPSMDRMVALKVLPSQLADNVQFLGRFQQEARIIARLEHPHILPVFDFGQSDHIYYLVMRYLEAGTLADKMNAGPLSLEEIDRIFTQLAEALGYAHSHGVIHRDLKPSNALIDTQGNLFLTDFGIAKLLEGTSHFTQTDTVMGTPAYISPEQAQGLSVDQRSDIYSLGIILYEMITGRLPFTADTPLAVILKHINDPLPLPSSVNPNIPQAIEQVVLKALAKSPEDRFGTTAEFLAAWKRARANNDFTVAGLDAQKNIDPTFVHNSLNVPNQAKQNVPPTVAHNSPNIPEQAKQNIPPTVAHNPPNVSQQAQENIAPTVNYTNRKSSQGWMIGLFVGIGFVCLVGLGILVYINRDFFSLPKLGGLPSGSSSAGQFDIAIGDQVSSDGSGSGKGVIEKPGSKDVYDFTAEPGTEIYIQIIKEPESGNTIDFYMADEAGSNIFSGCLQCGDPGSITLERGGKYVLTVGSDDPANSGYGAYSFKIWDVPAPQEFPIELDTPIKRDVPAAGAGFIESPGALDIYTFTLASAQDVYFQVLNPPTTNDLISWQVQDASGIIKFDTCLQCGDAGLVNLEAGMYTITVGKGNNHGAGAYEIEAWQVPPPQKFEIKIGDSVSQDQPGPGAGNIEAPGSFDVYTFTASAGQTVALSVLTTPNSSNLINWKLVDEAGTELFNNCMECGDPDPITLTQSGAYQIIVGSKTDPGTGGYEFRLYKP